MKISPLIQLTVDDTELQMLYEAVRRVKPFADLSPDMAERERLLEARLYEDVQRVMESEPRPNIIVSEPGSTGAGPVEVSEEEELRIPNLVAEKSGDPEVVFPEEVARELAPGPKTPEDPEP